MVETIAPELIMLDVTMPKMDGYELCHALKANPRTATIPIIFISALSEPLDKVKAFKTGGVDYVTKPFDADEVLARVETHLRLERLRRELELKNRELERLNELKNRFIGIAAHDLRSPLTAVIGYSEMLQQHATDDHDSEMLMRILRSSRFILRLVNDLLDISAIEAGSIRLDLEPTDLVELVRTNVDLNASLAAPKQISVQMEHDGSALQFRMDAAKLEQVLNNLIGNAVKFSLPGTRVCVKLQREGDMAKIAVEDQGPGIPAAELEGMFEPFQTTSVKSTAGEKSTGLGLAIAKKIVIAHGGEIRAESVVVRGTTFHFTIPLNNNRL
jgi:signal transduction histidine kinase